MSTETLSAAHKFREVDVPPVACASCGGQYPDRRHVDFSAGYEGVAIPPERVTDVAGAKWQHVDDLIVCEDCLVSAGAVIGLGDLTKATEENERLAGELVLAQEKLKAATDYIETVEAAMDQREALAATLKPATRRKA